MRLFALSLFAALTLGFSACKATDPTNPPTPVSTNSVQTTAGIVRISCQLSVYWALGQDANSRAYFSSAVLLLGSAIDSGQYDPVQLSNILATITINQVRQPVVAIAIKGALGIYELEYASAVSRGLDKTVWVKPILVGIRDGIAAGLNDRATEATFKLKRR